MLNYCPIYTVIYEIGGTTQKGAENERNDKELN